MTAKKSVLVEKVEETKAVEEKALIKKIKTPQLLRGFRDILPEDQPYWDAVHQKGAELALAYGYDRIELPLVESAELFARSVGKQTDIVEKEMFLFPDASGTNIVLRPEATASCARAYIEHGMVDRPQPVKMYYQGPMFRYERPQAGRYRQFYQLGFESFGSADPVVDAEMIILGNILYNELGLPVVAHVNSLGTPESRTQYKVELVAHYRKHRNDICEDCKRRIVKNPLRVLDCKEEGCQNIKNNAPQLLDFLDEASKEHFMKVLEYLDEMNVSYVLTPHLVRGLDYYSHTVFEFYLADQEEGKRQSALGGGGRYDGLVELLGGRPTPACGFAPGVDRIMSAMKEKELSGLRYQPTVYLAPLGDAARKKAFPLFESLRQGGVLVTQTFGKSALKGQLEAADKAKCVTL